MITDEIAKFMIENGIEKKGNIELFFSEKHNRFYFLVDNKDRGLINSYYSAWETDLNIEKVMLLKIDEHEFNRSTGSSFSTWGKTKSFAGFSK